MEKERRIEVPVSFLKDLLKLSEEAENPKVTFVNDLNKMKEQAMIIKDYNIRTISYKLTTLLVDNGQL